MITVGKSNIFFWTLDGSTFTLSKVAGNFEVKKSVSMTVLFLILSSLENIHHFIVVFTESRKTEIYSMPMLQ